MILNNDILLLLDYYNITCVGRPRKDCMKIARREGPKRGETGPFMQDPCRLIMSELSFPSFEIVHMGILTAPELLSGVEKNIIARSVYSI